jgi:exopolyphosphatase/guanosine-5'-triphosphate,3'-diphosphate pyrophosphatase
MTTTVVGRWEWRSFGASFGEGEARLTALTPTRSEESDEVYVLTRGTDASIKVRAGVLDIKRRIAVDANGLEQWLPVAKAEFPINGEDVGALLSALGLPQPPTRDVATLDELVAAAPQLRAVAVHKQRTHYSLGGCLAELSVLATDAGSTRTIVVEGEDPARVWAAVSELGLAGRVNTCVARGLKALVGRRFAVLDVGTNSVKFHLAERGDDGGWRTLADRAEITRLGEGLDETGRLGDAAIERTHTAILGMVDEADRHAVDAIAAVGTAALRIADNPGAFIDPLQARCGVQVEVLPGDEEARLAYLGATAELGPSSGTRVVFDTGGGSSQFTFGSAGRIDERFSLDVGAVRFTERFGLAGPVSQATVHEALEAIATELARIERRPGPEVVVGMGGAVTNLTAVKHGLVDYDPEIVQGTVLDRDEIDRQIELYRTRTTDERRALAGLQPNRAEVILAGACIVRTVLALLGAESLTVSDRGLRHGLLAERFARPS